MTDILLSMLAMITIVIALIIGLAALTIEVDHQQRRRTLKRKASHWNEVVNRDLDRMHHAQRVVAEQNTVAEASRERGHA